MINAIVKPHLIFQISVCNTIDSGENNRCSAHHPTTQITFKLNTHGDAHYRVMTHWKFIMIGQIDFIKIVFVATELVEWEIIGTDRMAFALRTACGFHSFPTTTEVSCIYMHCIMQMHGSGFR